MLVNNHQYNLTGWRIQTCFLNVRFETMKDTVDFQAVVILLIWKKGKQYV